MLVSTFEVLVKPQFPRLPGSPLPQIDQLTRNVIQGYFLTIANVNFFPVTVSLVFTIRFPEGTTVRPKSFDDFIQAVDISGENLLPGPSSTVKLVPEIVPQNNKARITFTLPENGTGLLILQPNILDTKLDLLTETNFEARGYVEIFLSSLSGSNDATLLVTPEQRGTFYRSSVDGTIAGETLDQIAYSLPVSNGGVFNLSNI